MKTNEKLTGVINSLKESAEGETKVSLVDVAENLNHRGFGPLLIMPCLLVMLPTGAIPGVPALAGLFICLIASQMIVGRKNPWIPQRLKKYSFKSKKFLHALDKAKPFAKFVDKFIRPRLQFLTQGGFDRAVAVLCLILALGIVILGFIPFLPSVIALPIFFFALGMSTKDGVMTLSGLAFSFAAILFLSSMMGFGGGDSKDTIKIEDTIFGRAPAYLIELDLIDLNN